MQKLGAVDNAINPIPRDGMVFICAIMPILSGLIPGNATATTGAMLVIAWCLIIMTQAFYAGLALNAARPGKTMNNNVPAPADLKAGHLANILATGCDNNYHQRRLHMAVTAISPANFCVMAAAGICGLAAFGPLWALAGPALTFILAVYSYSRRLRYAIWGMSAFVLCYTIQQAVTANTPVIAELENQMAGISLIVLALSGLVSIIAYHLTFIINLRHVAGLAFAHAALSSGLVLGIAQTSITDITLLSLLIFAPGLCMLWTKTNHRCHYNMYGNSRRTYTGMH